MNKCVICKGIFTKSMYDGIRKCQKCGHVFFDLNLSDEELHKLYGRNYFFGGEYNNYLKDKKILQKNFKLRMRILQKFLEPARHKYLLEIGCAYGFFLDIAKDQFHTTQGIDIAEDGVSYARTQLKLDAINANFTQHNWGNQKFDVVCMWDTIEHLRDPDIYLEKISNLMVRGSLLALTTGDIESLNARIRKKKWRLMHPPTHIHYFSRRTLAKLLDNHGFDVIYNQYCGFYRSIDLIAYRTLMLNKKRPWLYNILQKSGIANIGIYSNLYDIMCVVARKR